MLLPSSGMPYVFGTSWKSELELAAQKALELLDYVSDITTVDGKILAIMGLITGLSGQAKVSHILFEQAKIHSTDIASLYYYRALVHFHNEKLKRQGFV